MTPVKTQPCPECGGTMCYERRDDALAYKGQERIRKNLAWWCTKCGEAIFAGKALLARDRAFQQLKAEVDHVLGPDEVATVRGKLRLSQRRAGEVLVSDVPTPSFAKRLDDAISWVWQRQANGAGESPSGERAG